MKVAFVVHFFDFRNDVRELIRETSKEKTVILFVKKEHELSIKNHPIPNTEIRVIKEKINNWRNKILEKTYYYLKIIPKSRQNFFLMESFKIASIKNLLNKKKGLRNLNIIMKLPKIFSYDSFISNLKYSGETKISDIDNFIFFTEVSDDYFFARCIKENKKILLYSYSWDHPYKHTRFSNKIKYLTWSEETKKDLINLQNISATNIEVWGSSQLSYIYNYLNDKSTKSRTYNFKYIYYACAIGIESLVPQEIKIIKLLNELIKTYCPEIKFIVRPYPILQNWDLYHELIKEGIILDDKFRTKDLSIGENSINEKFEKISNAVMLLHLGTTMGLEASFLNTPSFLIDFGYNKNSSELLHVKHFIHQGQNVKYLINSCPEQHLTTKEQFIKNLNEINHLQNYNHKINSNFKLNSLESLKNDLFKS